MMPLVLIGVEEVLAEVLGSGTTRGAGEERLGVALLKERKVCFEEQDGCPRES